MRIIPIWKRVETWVLVLAVVLIGFVETTYVSFVGIMSSRVELFGYWVVAMTAAQWIRKDARIRRFPLWYDFDTGILFFGPLLLILYAFCSRGVRGFLLLLGFLGVYLLITILTVVYGYALGVGFGY